MRLSKIQHPSIGRRIPVGWTIPGWVVSSPRSRGRTGGRRRRAALVLGFSCLAALGPSGAAAPQDGDGDNELDRFMAQVLARRAENRLARRQYVFDEVERFTVTGPGGEAYRTSTREYVWYERDGVFVRSPVRIEGVVASESDWRRYEADWLEAEAERARDAASGTPCETDGGTAPPTTEGAGGEPAPEPDGARTRPSASADGDTADGAESDREPLDLAAAADLQPRFLSEAYWLDFEFEPGNYYFAGREPLAGRDVLRIEYYPERLFARKEDEKCGRDPAITIRGDPEAFNQNALVTLWIDPAEHQIVRFTFDNAGFDFLPLRWLFRLDGLTASMTMGRPLDDVWLPERIEASGVLTMAAGTATVAWDRTFTNYRLARTGGRVRPVADPR